MDDQCGTHDGLRELALFAGAGGGILGGYLLGWRTVCAVERDPYAASVLVARQNEGILPPFPIWDDVCTFDGKPWRGGVDVVSGGFPCQDISAAGRGAGIDGERSGLWSEMARIIGEVRPRFAFVENSPILTSRGLGRVLGDLAAMGYDARWGVLGSRHTGGPMRRDRIWILASSCGFGWDTAWKGKVDCKLTGKTKGKWKVTADREDNLRILRSRYSDQILSRDFRGCDELADRVDRLRAIGNGQVPAVAAMAWTILTGPK